MVEKIVTVLGTAIGAIMDFLFGNTRNFYILLAVVCLTGFFGLYLVLSKTNAELRTECESKNGVLILASNQFICLDENVVL